VEHTIGKRLRAPLDRIMARATQLRTGVPDDARSRVLQSITVPTPSVFQPAVAAAPDDLALHLSRRVIESHGGRMGVEAATAGRSYWVTLPTEPRMSR
jgi:hypothetical protein